MEVIENLNREGVEYVVIGGVALNLQGIVRATEDLDLFIKAAPENVNRLKAALKAVWNDPEIDQITSEDLCGEYPAVRYGPPSGTLFLDILTRLGETFRFEDLQAETKNVTGIDIRVATPKTLFRLKANTVRPIDKADAGALVHMYPNLNESEDH